MQKSEGAPFLLTCTDTYFYLRYACSGSKESMIRINRLTSKVTVLSEERYRQQLSSSSEKKNSDKFYLLGGVSIVNQQPYLCLVLQAQAVATVNSQKIFCVRRVSFVPFKHKYLYKVINQAENQKILQQMSNSILADNFYFSYNRDLTLTCQKIYQKRSTEKKYFWNEYMLKMFNHYELPQCWRVPMIQGHVKQLFCENDYFSFYYCVISRRSKYMSGTRYNSRGIDTKSNVANFVESEQIFVCHNYLMTHVSIRGSVPIFWGQAGFGEPVKFSRPDQQNMLVIENHFQFLKRQYQSNVVAINLLSKVNENERDLANRYQFYLYKTIPNQPYIHYDFNQQIKNKESTRNQVIDKFIADHLDKFAPDENFFCIDRFTGKLFNQQSILPRINCLDCLDRSNVIMSRISLIFIQQVQAFINSHTNMVQKKISLSGDYKQQIVEIWAELGNRISLIYSGTDSISTHLTKQEESSFFSFISQAFKSVGRYYHANVNDEFKQVCIDFLLGEKQENSRTTFFDDNIVKGILKETRYCHYEEIIVYMLSWNCNMVDPQKLTAREMEKLFNFPIDKTDVVVVCLQEMVELSSYNVLLGNNESIVNEWEKVIEKYLNDVGHDLGKSFVHLTSRDMVGIATFVFISGALFNRVYKSEWHEVKTGFKNNLGNKGAILFFMQIDSSFLTFTNCHLAAGEKADQQRQQDIQYIHNDALNQRAKRRLFDKSQYKFFIGDMNFRLQAKNEYVRQILYTIEKQDAQKKLTKQQMQGKLSILMQKDEFQLNKFKGSLSLYNEATVYFLPTYKYVKKEKIYDTKRTPAWCDRILFNSTDPKKLAVLKYWDVDCYKSDHKPICGAFKLLIKKEDPDRKSKQLQKYMLQSD